MRAALAWAAAAATAAILTAGASATPFFGVADNEVGATEWGREQTRALGVPAMRLFVWFLDREEPTGDDLELIRGAQATGARVFATISQPHGYGLSPTTESRRACFARFAARLVELTGVRDVMVWNEPNSEGFFGGPVDASAYGQLLAATHDALHPLGARVWAFNTARAHDVDGFIHGVADWYRASGRTARLFDGVSHHPYPADSAAPYASRNAGDLYLVGDTKRLLNLIDHAFRHTPQCPRRCGFPLVYGELGWPTDWMPFGFITPQQQARTLVGVRDFLARFRRVEGVFNFELRDSQGWRTGLFHEDGRPKPAARALYGRDPLPAPEVPVPLIGTGEGHGEPCLLPAC